MNCKPNELAYIKLPGPHFGKVIRVLELDPLALPTAPAWLYEGHVECLNHPHGGRYESLRDSILRPIRDPGDDARDELLRPLPQEVTA